MSKDKKNEGKEILEEFKELSEWQKRNQEYLKKKAEEEAALAEEKEKERQARMASKSEKSDATEDQESESDPKDPESAKEDAKEKAEDSEEVKKEVSKEKSKSTESTEKENQDKKLAKKATKEKPAKAKIPAIHILRALTILFPSLLLLIVSAYLLSPYATMKDIRVEGTVQTTDDDIRQASGIQDSDYTINLLLDKAKYEEQIKSNYWVESAQLVYQFPIMFTIKVKEYDIVAYYISGENHYPILSSGQLETSSVSLVSLPETYLSVLFNDSEQIKTFTSELAQISPELKA
ncbi:MAG: FtsQ-type POTRA domain-containing protein, partial [Catonella sp.]